MEIIRKVKNEKISFLFALVIIIISALLYSIGVVVFVSPASLLSSGVSGIALIIGRIISSLIDGKLTDAQISGVFYLILNIPIMVLAFKKFSLKFTILSILHALFTSIFTTILPKDLVTTMLGSDFVPMEHQIEFAIFGAILCGSSTALSYMVGGSSAGIDLLSAYLNVKKQINVGKVGGICNGCIIALSLLLWHKDGEVINALYTLVFIILNAMVIDLLYISNRKVIVTIITEKGDEISNEINDRYTRGVTRMEAMGNYTKRRKDFLYIACTTMEAMEIASIAQQIDPSAFTSIMAAQRIKGNFINKQAKDVK